MLIDISRFLDVSPPASRIPNKRAARRIPRRNLSSHFPVLATGNASVIKNNRGVAPMAAKSLAARTSALYPIETGGCKSEMKWTPSRKASQLITQSYPERASTIAASSPIPSRNPLPPIGREGIARAILLMTCASVFTLYLRTVAATPFLNVRFLQGKP